MSLEVRVPITLPSIANARLHWAAKAKLASSPATATRRSKRAYRLSSNSS